MANGRQDWWNRGRREDSLKGSKSLDIIEQLSRIGGNMAGTVQNIRKERGSALQKSIGRIIGENGLNYKSLFLESDDAKIDAIKTQLENYAPRIERSDVDTRELYKFALDDIGKHKLQNQDYRNQTVVLENLYNDMVEASDNYYNTQAAIGSEGNQKAYDKMNSLAEQYLGIYNTMMSNHSERIKNDVKAVSMFKTMDVTTRFAMEQYISGDKRTDPLEYEALKTAMLTKNPKIIDDFRAKRATAQGYQAQSYAQQFDFKNKQIEDITKGLVEKFHYSGAILDPSKYTHEGGRGMLESIIKKKIDDNSLVIELNNELKNYSGGTYKSWKELAGDPGLATDYYIDIFNKNPQVQQLVGLKADAEGINEQYSLVNMGRSLKVEESGKVGETKPQFPTYNLSEKMSKHVGTIKSRNMFGKVDGKYYIASNNIYDIQNLVKDFIKNAKSDGEKKQIKAAYNALLNGLEKGISDDSDSREQGFIDLNSFYGGQVNRIQ